MDKFYFTDAGLEYIAKTADGKVLCFTKGKFGSGTPSGDIADMTDLDSPLGELQITNKDVDDNKVTVRTVFSNVKDGAVMQGFRLKELGLFAKLQDPGGTDALGYPETLIAYACVSGGDQGDLIAGSPTDYVISWPFVISNADNVEVLVDQSAYALHSDVSELMETKADRQTATGGFTAGRNAAVATVAGTAIEYMYIGQWKNGQKLSYVSGAPEGLYDKNNTTPPVNSAAQIFNVFDLGAERNISAVTLYVADGGASLTNMVCLTNDLTGGRSNYIDVLRTNGEVQNGVPVIENKLSSDGYIKVGHTDGGYIGKYRYVLVYDWSNVCKASELYVETDTAETPIPAIQLGEGTNAKAYTMQVYGHQLLDEDGHIPEERIEDGSIDPDKLSKSYLEIGDTWLEEPDESTKGSPCTVYYYNQELRLGSQGTYGQLLMWLSIPYFCIQYGDALGGTAYKWRTPRWKGDLISADDIPDGEIIPTKASFTSYPVNGSVYIGKWNGQYDIYRTCIFKSCTSAAEDITVSIPGSGTTSDIIPINVQLTLWEQSTGKIYKLDTDCEITGTGSKSLKFSKPEGISGQLYGYVEYMDISV